MKNKILLNFILLSYPFWGSLILVQFKTYYPELPIFSDRLTLPIIIIIGTFFFSVLPILRSKFSIKNNTLLTSTIKLLLVTGYVGYILVQIASLFISLYGK